MTELCLSTRITFCAIKNMFTLMVMLVLVLAVPSSTNADITISGQIVTALPETGLTVDFPIDIFEEPADFDVGTGIFPSFDTTGNSRVDNFRFVISLSLIHI